MYYVCVMYAFSILLLFHVKHPSPLLLYLFVFSSLNIIKVRDWYRSRDFTRRACNDCWEERVAGSWFRYSVDEDRRSDWIDWTWWL